MNILVVTNMAPFTWGGAEELTTHLVHNLKLSRKLSVEAVRIPFTWEPAERLVEQVLLCRSLRLSNVDLVIALKFPAYLVPHPKKIFWLLHQYRQAYDLWDAGQSNIPNTPRGQDIRKIIKTADDQAFEDAERIFVNSSITGERLKRYNGWDSEILLPPLNDPELFCGGEDQGYLLAVGRVNAIKRQLMAVEAMRHVPSNIRLIVAGPPDTAADAEELQARVREYQLDNRVVLDLRLLSRQEIAAYVNGARAIVYLPYEEDSLGYVTMESFQASKPVITTLDSGGLLQIVKHGHTGYVVAPKAQALAESFAAIVANPDGAKRMGHAAHDLWTSFGINWSNTIERLLA